MQMYGCPLHGDSLGRLEDGEIVKVSCPVCGEYRISETAIARMVDAAVTPEDWRTLVRRRPLISTRDLRYA